MIQFSSRKFRIPPDSKGFRSGYFWHAFQNKNKPRDQLLEFKMIYTTEQFLANIGHGHFRLRYCWMRGIRIIFQVHVHLLSFCHTLLSLSLYFLYNPYFRVLDSFSLITSIGISIPISLVLNYSDIMLFLE